MVCDLHSENKNQGLICGLKSCSCKAEEVSINYSCRPFLCLALFRLHMEFLAGNDTLLGYLGVVLILKTIHEGTL